MNCRVWKNARRCRCQRCWKKATIPVWERTPEADHLPVAQARTPQAESRVRSHCHCAATETRTRAAHWQPGYVAPVTELRAISERAESTCCHRARKAAAGKGKTAKKRESNGKGREEVRRPGD